MWSLPQRLRLERHADLIIGIGSYKTDEEARYFEAYYSAKYGIPTVPFTPRPHQAISGELLTRLFKDINTRANINKMAEDMGLELESPQFLVDAVTRGVSRRIKINFEMCFRNYRSKSNKNGFVGKPGFNRPAFKSRAYPYQSWKSRKVALAGPAASRSGNGHESG